VLVHGDRTAGKGGAPTQRFNAQAQILNAYRAVAIHSAFELQREKQIQISAGAVRKRTAALCRRHLKTHTDTDVRHAALRGWPRICPEETSTKTAATGD